MSKTTIPFRADDVSSLAKALRAQLVGRDSVPGHVEILNMLARSIGRRNFQHLRAEAVLEAATAAPLAPEPEPLDHRRIERVARCFGPEGRLLRWPAKRDDQILALWGLWSKLPARQDLSEREISEAIKRLHDFGDHALLRRELVDLRLLSRTQDGRVYRRVERVPPPDAAGLAATI